MLSLTNFHFLTGEEITAPELKEILVLAQHLKNVRNTSAHTDFARILSNKSIALIFEKPSLRTRVSFSVGVQELGGYSLELQGSQKKNEEPEDAIQVLQGMVHGVMIRTFEHKYLERMLPVAKIPIINGLSDSHHPCQTLADLQTCLQSFGELKGLTIAYIGDGNNILHSLLLIAPLAGVNINYASPSGYQPDQTILVRAQKLAELHGTKIKCSTNPIEAVSGANAVYTDVWTSMGFEKENAERMKAFAGYQLNAELFSKADSKAIVLHCLPMLREQEITSEVADHERSRIFQQAENRLHAQKSLMVGLFNSKKLKSIH